MNAMPAIPPKAGPPAPMGEGYPDAADIPELKAKGMETAGTAPQMANPVVDAVKTIGEFVLAAEKNGNPNAAAMKEHLVGLLQAISSGGSETQMGQNSAGTGAPAPMGQAEPPAAPESPFAEEGEMPPAPMEEENPEMVDMMAGRKNKVRRAEEYQPLI